MVKSERIQWMWEAFYTGIIIEELVRKLEKIRQRDGRCKICGNDLTEREIEESDTCDKCTLSGQH